jgi:colanic acid biosynthesis glycosyl transferase WcaI
MLAGKKLGSQRVIFVNRYYEPDESATSQMLTDLARGLAVKGFDVHVVCSRQLYDSPGTRLVPHERRSNVAVHRVVTTRFGRRGFAGRAMDYASFYVNCAAKLLGLLRRGDILVVMTDPPLLSILSAPIAKAKGVAFITWQQDVFPEIASHLGANPLPNTLDAFLRRIRDASLRTATMNVVIGNRMQAYFLARRIEETRIRVIENWADETAITPKPTNASVLRASLNLGPCFVACYSGNLGRAHEFDTLLEAADHLRTEQAYVFLMIGGGAKMDALKRAVDARELKNFRFLPYQPRETLEDSLAAADVQLACLLPALEGLIVPSKLYGVLAAGRPMIFIGDTNGHIGRVIELAECGLAVDVGDWKALVAALRKLAKSTDCRQRMGERARRLLCDEYGLSRAIDKWVALLGAVSGRR